MVFLNFLNVFVIFLEFSIARRVGTEWNDNFYFLSFSTFSQPISAGNDAIIVFFNFLNFFAFVLEFSISCRERNGTESQFLFSLFLCVLQPILA